MAFLAAAQSANLTNLVDLACLRACLDEAMARKLPGAIHVNMFPSTILATPPERLLSLFPSEPGPCRFVIEISEQQFVGDPMYLRDHLAKIREAGIQIAIDDVGFGRTSLEVLVVLMPDIIKIDRKYVTGCASNPRRLERLVRALRALGGELVAEGVEDDADRDWLLQLGIHRAQGFLWGQPA